MNHAINSPAGDSRSEFRGVRQSVRGELLTDARGD